MLKLLKPGGFIQWDEIDGGSCKSHAPNASVAIPNLEHVMSNIAKMQVKMGWDFDWIPRLSEAFAIAGLSDIDAIEMGPHPVTRRAWTEDMLMAWEDVALKYLSYYTDVFSSREDFERRMVEIVKEKNKGAAIDHTQWCFVGRKSE